MAMPPAQQPQQATAGLPRPAQLTSFRIHSTATMRGTGLLSLALLAAATAAASGQADNAACVAMPLASGGAVLEQSDNGVTNPELLNTLVKEVDEVRLFSDSKTIVDMPLKASPAEVASAFRALQLPEDPAARNETLRAFVDQWLLPAGSDLVNATEDVVTQEPPDWFDAIDDPEYRAWAYDLFELWKRLTAKQLAPEVFTEQERFTMLPVPNPFVIPGARFREVYYWDTFWVLEGLLASNLTQLAEGIIGNFVQLMREYGHIPNGIRTYYINRSQPPLFSEMVRIVYGATGNGTMLREALPALLREHAYWTASPKQVIAISPDGREFKVSRYYARWNQPRPESYLEDVETAREAGLDPANPNDRTRQLWRNLASGAESGWDFSSRWFEDGQNLTTIRTTRILPADLNAFLFQMESNIQEFAAELGCQEVESTFRQLAAERREALDTLFWDPSTSQWHDLVCTPVGTKAAAPGAEGAPPPAPEAIAAGQLVRVCNVERNPTVFASNWAPLWVGAADPGSEQAVAAVQALNSSGLLGPGGVSMSLVETGNQWDFPNSWPPIQWMLIDGAERYGGEPDMELARRMTGDFLNTVYATYEQTGRMFEKFDSRQVGVAGGGGEYTVVDGFGWTNGASLDLLQRFHA